MVGITDLGLGVRSNVCMSMKIVLPVRICWRPQADITTHELARLLPIIFRQAPLMPYEVPTEPELLRHLEVHNPNIPEAP